MPMNNQTQKLIYEAVDEARSGMFAEAMLSLNAAVVMSTKEVPHWTAVVRRYRDIYRAQHFRRWKELPQ